MSILYSLIETRVDLEPTLAHSVKLDILKMYNNLLYIIIK
jgi:hypothetical protein